MLKRYLLRIKRPAVVVIAAVSLVACTQAQQVTKIMLGPETNLNYASFSEDFTHVAYVGTQGTRQVVYWDGKAGAEFDKIPSPSPVVSADGLHCAYSGQRGAESFVVVDNKEYGPFDVPTRGNFYKGYGGKTPSKEDATPYDQTPFQSIVFSPDGTHFGFIAKKSGQTVVYEDGKEIAAGKLVIGDGLLFSSRGNHLAFALQDAAQRSVTYYMDGVAGPVFFNGKQPQFSVDGHHLFYIAEPAPGSETFVLDGKAGPAFEVVREIHVSQDGSHFAYVGASRRDLSAIVDGKVFAGATQVWLSPDGAHFAYFQPTTKTSQVGSQSAGSVVVDGKAGQTYDRIQSLLFSPDDDVYYLCSSNQKTAVVKNGAESPTYTGVRWPVIFSSDGKHAAYTATDASGTFVVLDGKPLQHFDSIAQPEASGPKFLEDGSVMYHATLKGKPVLVHDDQIVGEGGGVLSPNGRRVALLKTTGQGSSESTAQMVVDGMPGPTLSVVSFMAFSPDSRHFAYVGAVPGRAGEYQLFVDGKPGIEMPDCGGLAYSPDSQHLVVRAVSHQGSKNDVLYLDQKPVLEAPATEAYGAIVHWSDNGRQLVLMARSTDHQVAEVKYLEGSRPSNRTNTDGAIDHAELQRMLGSGNMITSGTGPSGSSATSSRTTNTASGNSRQSNGVPFGGATVILKSGTTLHVKLVDPVDSQHPSQTSRYRGELIDAVDAAGSTIPAGSAVEMELAHTGNDWALMMVSVAVDGRPASVGSNQMVVPVNEAVTRVKNTVSALGGLAGSFGVRMPKRTKPSAPALQQLVLAPGMTIDFEMH
jgi:hypothetical protein